MSNFFVSLVQMMQIRSADLHHRSRAAVEKDKEERQKTEADPKEMWRRKVCTYFTKDMGMRTGKESMELSPLAFLKRKPNLPIKMQRKEKIFLTIS